MAVLYLSWNPVVMGQDLPKDLSIPLSIIAPYSFPYHPDGGMWAH
jgi:hypothetical protein